MFTLIHTADTPTGRVDRHTLSDQSMMELLIADADPEFQATFQGTDGAYLDICEWKGVQCNSDTRVTSVRFAHGTIPVGSLDLRYIPLESTEFRVIDVDAEGSIVASDLPQSLTNFEVSFTEFIGDVDMRLLPRSLTEVHIAHNHNEGSLDLAELPPGLRSLNAYWNSFRGTITLKSLPASLQELDLSSNELSGTLCLDALPSSLTLLVLEDNCFEGSVCLEALPATLSCLNLCHNRLCGPLNLEKLPEAIAEVLLNDNEFCGEFVLRRYYPRMKFLCVEGNALSGVAVVASSVTARLQLFGNAVKSCVDESGKAAESRANIRLRFK